MSESKNLHWVKVPKGYRVTRAEKNRYDLESTLPLRLEFRKVTDLGTGLRVESKGWGTGAYRVYRVSTEPLGDSLNYKPELVHIPASEFWTGEQETGNKVSHDTKPSPNVSLAEYWISRYPVTVNQFAFFVEHHGYTTTKEENYPFTAQTWCTPQRENYEIQKRGSHPVTFVSLRDAQAYCRWLSKATGVVYDLPTQEQWEKAAYGTDGRKYPWGNSEPDSNHCNIEHWFGDTTPVGQFSPDGDGPKFDNPCGCADMLGNVSELTLDTHRSTYAIHPDCDPDFYYYKTTTSYITCGASWRMSRQSRSDYLGYNASSRDAVGFRVVAYPSTRPNSASQ